MVDVTKIAFRDIYQRERHERERLTNRQGQLRKIDENRKNLSTDERAELVRITAILDTIAKDHSECCDPLFVGIRDLFNGSPGILSVQLKNHSNGVFEGSAPKNGGGLTMDAVVRAALTIGLSIVDETEAPPVKAAGGNKSPAIVSMTAAPEYGGLSRGFYAAIGEVQAMHDLAVLVLPILAQEGDPRGTADRSPGSVDAAEFARVMRALAKRGVTAKEGATLQLRRLVNQSLDRIQFVGEERPINELGIDLPDLEAESLDIVPDNVRLMGPMVCAAMFDELKAFQVVDKLVELFQHGMLTIGSGEAGNLLYKYWKDAPNRMSEGERKNFYAMTMGIPGGESGGMINREFNDLWIRFVSSVSSFIRQNEVDKLLRAALPSPISQQQVRKAARDLAVNLSLHGYGMAFYAAIDLQEQIGFMIRLLGDPDIRNAYGARDMWQVIDQVATLELGGAKTSSRYRTLATCGGIITAWLANNVRRITRPTGPIIDIDDVRSPIPRSNGQSATKNPTDYDLVNACELWLADTATSDTRVDELAQPREAPATTSRPVQIPSIAREMLDGIGLGMGQQYQNTRH
jgi:hypothetical protein